MQRPTQRRLSLLVAGWLSAALPLCASAQAPNRPEQGRGLFAITYQNINIDGFQSTIGKLDIGTAETHSLNFEVDYELSERWSVSAGIPLIKKRYRGPGPHDPTALVPPRDAPLIDDGEYHGRLQDVHLGARYLVKERPLTIETFVALGVPSHDYPFFGHAAVGQNLRRVELGAAFAYSPPLSDFYFRVTPGYVFVEETLGVSIDHWRLDTEVGYFFTPRLTGRLFVMVKDGRGLLFPDDFPPPRTTERWYQHDRMVKHNYVNAGLGADYALSERNRLSVSAMRMVRAEQVHVMEYTLTFGLVRTF